MVWITPTRSGPYLLPRLVPDQRIVALAGDLLDAGAFLQHFLRLRHDALADGRHAHLGAAALEQGHAQLVLQLADRHRQGRLADETGLGRTAEMPFARHRDDVFEFGQCHSATRSRYAAPPRVGAGPSST